MRNLKSVHLVTTGDLLNPQLEGFLGSNRPLIQSGKCPRVYRKLNEALRKIKKTKVRGILKLALSALYFITLLYFLTLLLL
jgi:hypothetical protein